MSMKKIITAALISLAVAGLSACVSKAAENQSTDQDSTTEVVDDATSTQDEGLILASVRNIYEMRPQVSFTPEFQHIIDAANEKSVEEGCEVGYFDWYILTNSQDPGQLNDVEIVKLKDGDSAIVKVFGEFSGENGYVIVTVKRVDGEYLIDDIEGFDGKSVKQSAQDYING